MGGWLDDPEPSSIGGFGGRWGLVVEEKVVVRVAAAGDLADLGVPGELGVEALEGPEAVGAEGELPVGLGLVALLPHSVYVLPLFLVPLLRILH